MHWNTTENNHLLVLRTVSGRWQYSCAELSTQSASLLHNVQMVHTRNSSTTAFVGLCGTRAPVSMYTYTTRAMRGGNCVSACTNDSVLCSFWRNYHLLRQSSKLFRSQFTKQAENGAVSELNNHSDLHTLKTSIHSGRVKVDGECSGRR